MWLWQIFFYMFNCYLNFSTSEEGEGEEAKNTWLYKFVYKVTFSSLWYSFKSLRNNEHISCFQPIIAIAGQDPDSFPQKGLDYYWTPVQLSHENERNLEVSVERWWQNNLALSKWILCIQNPPLYSWRNFFYEKPLLHITELAILNLNCLYRRPQPTSTNFFALYWGFHAQFEPNIFYFSFIFQNFDGNEVSITG